MWDVSKAQTITCLSNQYNQVDNVARIKSSVIFCLSNQNNQVDDEGRTKSYVIYLSQ